MHDKEKAEELLESLLDCYKAAIDYADETEEWGPRLALQLAVYELKEFIKKSEETECLSMNLSASNATTGSRKS